MFRTDEFKSFIQRLLGKIRNFFRSNSFRQSLVFLFFLALASLFWIVHNMRENYVQTFEIPIIYEHLPPGVVLTGDLPENMQITISAKGASVLNHSHIKGFDSLRIDVLKIKREKNFYTVSSDYLKSEISKQLDPETVLTECSPDNIRIYYASK